MVDVTPDKLTKAFIKIRTERALLQAEFTEKEAKLVRQQDRVKQAMRDHCERHNAESVRTSEGLFFRSRRIKYWTSDWDAMHNFILEHNVPQLLDKRINQSNLKEFLEENPDTTPRGLETETEVVISVRKK